MVGSGPAGLAAAQQLARAGHDVVVYERDDRIGGLLRYGIPDFKMEKGILDARVEQMRAEGVTFRVGVAVGLDLRGEQLQHEFDAVVLTLGSRTPRDLSIPGRELRGIHFAMEYLSQQNHRVAGDGVEASRAILATGKRVVVIGGGDTGSDCVGTALRQGAVSVTQLELMPRPALARLPSNPWPEWPLILRTSSSQEEGVERDWSVSTRMFRGEEGRVTSLEASRVVLEGGRAKPVPGDEMSLPCELVLLAMGFVGPERGGVVEQLGLALDGRGNIRTDAQRRHERARCLRWRRRRTRPVSRRLGHRRRTKAAAAASTPGFVGPISVAALRRRTPPEPLPDHGCAQSRSRSCSIASSEGARLAAVASASQDSGPLCWWRRTMPRLNHAFG